MGLILFLLHFVARLDLAGGNVVEAALEHGAAQAAEAVGEDLAIEVVDFVLGYAGKEAVDFLGVLLPVLVPPMQDDGVGTEHVLVDVGDAEAAFVEVLLLSLEFQYLGVDEGVHVGGFAVGVGLFVIGTHTDGDEADGKVHLRGREAHAVGVVHGFEHVGDEFLQVGVVLRNGFGHFAQRGVAVSNNR